MHSEPSEAGMPDLHFNAVFRFISHEAPFHASIVGQSMAGRDNIFHH